MMKKGDLSLQVIVIAILALLVLLVLAFIFKDQITKTAKSYLEIGDKAAAEAKGERCQSIIGNRHCGVGDDAYEWIPVYPSSGATFSDCTETCYERGERKS